MGRPNDLFGPETLDNGDSSPRPDPRARPAEMGETMSPSGDKPTDDELITVSGMENVALVFLAMSGIREHQLDMIQRRLISVADRSHGKLAVSLSEVAALNSAGINVLVAVHTHCVSLGGHLAIFAASADIRRVFKVTKLDRKITISDNVHEAVQSFTRPRRGFFKNFGWAKQDRDAA